jgi:radical SAM protein with 4Fe4S-binding SPASM domain
MVGGEVMLRKDFFDILDYFKSIGMEIQIGTNGTLINEENAEKLKSNPNITAITFSIDGTKELHNSIRRTDFAFDNTIHGIKLVKNKIPTHVVTVLMKDNVNCIHDIVRLMNEIEVKNLTFEYERKYSKNELEESAKMMNLTKEDIPVSLTENKDHGYSVELLKEKLRECLDLGKKLGVNVGFFPKFLYEDLEDCYNETLRSNGLYLCKCLFTGRIDPQGNVIHCYAIRKSFGNLFEQSFEQIWNSDGMKEFRKKLLNNNLLPICETCLYMERVK